MSNQASKLIPLANINVVDRLRDTNPEWVAALAASMEDRGLDQPVLVRHSGDQGFFELVAGAHRLQAAHELSWEAIPAIVRPLDDYQARIAEIDENLMRRELNALDRAIFLLERKTVYQKLNPEVAHGGSRKIKSQTLRLDPKRFTAEVAEKIGLGERSVQLAIEIAGSLDPQTIVQLRSTPWANKQDTLLKLSKETPQRQRALVLQHRDHNARTLDEARTLAGFQDARLPAETDQKSSEQASILGRLLELWARAAPETREEFLAEIKQAAEVEGKKGARK